MGRKPRPFWFLELICRCLCYYYLLVLALHSDIPLSITTIVPFFTVCGAFRPLTDINTGYFEGATRGLSLDNSWQQQSSKTFISWATCFHSELPALSNVFIFSISQKLSSLQPSFISPTTHTTLILLHHVRTTGRYHGGRRVDRYRQLRSGSRHSHFLPQDRP